MNRDCPLVSLQAAVLCVVLAHTSLSLANESQITFDFERDVEAWKPRAESISVSRRQGGAAADSAGCLRVQGHIAVGWNYARSDPQMIQPGRLYRLTAQVRVDELGPGAPAPYLKCEFVGSVPRSSLGQVHTTAYEVSRLGQWQQLQVEFQTPTDACMFWLALEKGTSEPAEIDACVDEIRLEPIERLTVFEQYRLTPVPDELEQVRGVHPRLYLDAARITELRSAIVRTHAPLWREIQELADRAVQRGPPAYREDDGSSGSEQLWQRDVGNAMPVMAMAYVISGQRKYLKAAQAWALASCDYRTWGLGRIDGMDLAAGHQLFGLGIVYDWC